MTEYIKREDALSALDSVFSKYAKLAREKLNSAELHTDLEVVFRLQQAQVAILEAMKQIRAIPKVSVRDEIKGEWIEGSESPYGDIAYRCTNCGVKSALWVNSGDWKFCPDCGARMSTEVMGE